MAIVYLALGSNLGIREENIFQAIHELKRNSVKVKKVSSFIETVPVGGPKQGKFFNAALKAETKVSPTELLEVIQKIETKLGRVRTVANGPRTIDIDILLYDQITLSTPQLTIPHPRMLERDFVMQPLREIEPDIDKIIPHENR